MKDAEGTAVLNAKVTLKAIGSGNEPVYVNGSGTLVKPSTKHTDAAGLVTFTVTANASLIPANSYYRIEIGDIPGERKARVLKVQIPAVGSSFDVEDVLHDPGTIETSALAAHKVSVADHGDVDLTGNATGKVLMWNGTSFVPADTHATDLEVSSAVLVETNARTAADEALQLDVDSKETPAGAQAKVDAALEDAKRVDGTSLGDSSYDGATVTLDFDTKWGIDGLGDPYYDAEGVTGSEAAVLVVNPDGSLAVKKPTTTLTDDWNDSPSEVQTNLDTHEDRTDNPHEVTKTQVGLENVDNTSDASKPISSAAQSALDAKAPSSASFVTLAAEAGLSGETLLSALFSTGTYAARPAPGTAGRRYFSTDNPRGEWLDTGSAWIPVGDLTVRRTADSADKTNNTLANDDTLLWEIGANEVWFARVTLFVNAANTAMDANFGWSGPAGASATWGVEGITSNNLTGGWGPAITSATPQALLALVGTRTVGTFAGTMGIILAGTFVAAGTAGNVNLQWAQATTDAGALKLLANSFIKLTRLA